MQTCGAGADVTAPPIVSVSEKNESEDDTSSPIMHGNCGVPHRFVIVITIQEEHAAAIAPELALVRAMPCYTPNYALVRREEGVPMCVR